MVSAVIREVVHGTADRRRTETCARKMLAEHAARPLVDTGGAG
jgi:hypothetical protein